MTACITENVLFVESFFLMLVLFANKVFIQWFLMQAPEYSHVYLEFVDDFGITGHVDVCKDFVEVRYNTSLALTGARFVS